MLGKNEEIPSTRHGKVVAKTKVTTKQGCHRSYDDQPLSGFIHNNARGTTDLSKVLLGGFAAAPQIKLTDCNLFLTLGSPDFR